jgi:methanethiol S-methyltransferase
MAKRVLFFIYGSACYVVFLVTFLYAVGFIGGFGVPTRLDDPASSPLVPTLLTNGALLALFAVQHSVMARQWFKDAWTRIVPQPVERSTYVLFSSLALIAMFWLWRPLGIQIWTVINPVGRALLYGGFAFGWLLVLAATFLINHFDLFGMRQVWFALIDRPYTPLAFKTPGLYGMVRHPLYVGWLFTFWMTPTMTAAHLLFAVATTAYILVAIQFEERDLVRSHREYSDYRRRVPMLIPGLKRGGTATIAVHETDHATAIR